MTRSRAFRAGAAGVVAAACFAGVVSAGVLDEVSVTASAPSEQVVGPGLERLKAPVEVTCSAECDATADGSVVVDRRDKPTFELNLRPATGEFAAEGAETLLPRLTKSDTTRLQSALDERGTKATANVEVEASDDSGGSATAADSTVLVPGFDVVSARVKPKLAFFDARREPLVRFRFRAPEPTDVSVLVKRNGNGSVVKRFDVNDAEPFAGRSVGWNGIDKRGRYAGDGNYSFHVAAAGDRPRRVGRFGLRGHVFPVDGPHGKRSDGLGDFGDPRSGGRVHEGFDITANCGTRLVAARGGKVVRRSFDPVLYGWFVDIKARDSGRRLFYSHLRVPPPVAKGDRVRTGQVVGEVGQTGNAASTPCHLHFEIRVGGRPIDPAPELRRWDGWS